MKYLIPLLCILIGCGEKKEEPRQDPGVYLKNIPKTTDTLDGGSSLHVEPIEPRTPMRHFLIGYYCVLLDKSSHYGSITLGSLTALPTAKEIKDEIYCQLPRGVRSKKRIGILGIYEFKDDEEYFAFCQGVYRPFPPCK